MRRAGPVLVALAAALACRSVDPGVPLAPADPRPAALLSAWSASAGSRHALRGVARLAVDGDGVRIRGKQVLVAARPARLRVEVLGLLDQTLAVLVTDGVRYQLFRAREHSLETGAVDPGLLWREASLALSPEEAVELLLGAPLPDPALRVHAARRKADGTILMELADASGRVRQILAFDAEGRLRLLERRGPGGRTLWEARYDDYEPVAGVPFAHEIRLDIAAGDTHVEISLRDVELNPVLSPELFRLELRASIRGLGEEATTAALRID